MKVLLIDVYNYRKGGAESVCFNTEALLKKNGHETIRFTLKWPNNEDSEFAQYFPESKETRNGLLKQPKNFLNYFFHFEAAQKLSELLSAHKPDIAHIHLMWGQLTSSILPVLKKYNTPIIYTVHDYRLVCPAYTFRNGKGKICEKCGSGSFWHCFINNCCKNNRLYSVTMATEQYFRNLFFNPLKFINGFIFVSDFAQNIHRKHIHAFKDIESIRLYNFSTNRKTNSSDQYIEKKFTNPYFLYFGRLSAEKGLMSLLKTFTSFPNQRLVIVGNGPEEKFLKKFVADNNMENVMFMGYLSGEKLSDIISKAYFSVIPSEWYENNPMSIIESFSMGLPVIGAQIGGIPEIVKENETGFLFKSGDIESLSVAIYHSIKLSLTEYSQMSRNAYNFACNNFDANRYYENLIEFYKKIISNS